MAGVLFWSDYFCSQSPRRCSSTTPNGARCSHGLKNWFRGIWPRLALQTNSSGEALRKKTRKKTKKEKREYPSRKRKQGLRLSCVKTLPPLRASQAPLWRTPGIRQKQDRPSSDLTHGFCRNYGWRNYASLKTTGILSGEAFLLRREWIKCVSRLPSN